jgi:hypothetical protein
MSQIIITIQNLKSIKGDVNKKVSTHLKSIGEKVIDADVLVLDEQERGRCWVKRPGQTSVIAYG